MRHLREAFSFLVVTALCASALTCQNPVPTRVKVETYGAASGTPSPVELRIDLYATAPSVTVCVANGVPEGLAALLLGTEATAVPLPMESLLLIVPLAAVAGVFDSLGSFAVPIDIANPAFIGQSLYAQGFCCVPREPGFDVFQLTAGIRTTFFAGNEQPPLAYAGPPLTATLIARADPRIDTRHELLSSILVPTSGWNVSLSGTHTDSGVTSVYVFLEAPNPDEIVLPVASTVCLGVDFGFAAAPRIAVMIERRTRGMPSPPAFMLAAVIERDFGTVSN